MLYTNFKTHYSVNNISSYINEFNKENTIFSSGNEIIFPSSGETAVDIARSAAVQDSGIIIGGDLIILKINSNTELKFIPLIFLNQKYKRKIASLAQGKSIVHIHANDLKDLEIFIPQKSEQIKISNLIDYIEKLLTLYENKRKLLTALSQGLSQYLFNFSKEKNAIQMSLSSITVSETKGIAKENTLSLGNIEYLDTTRLNGGKAKLVSGKKDVDFRDIIVLWDGSNAGKIYYGFSGILGSTLKVFKLKDDINSEYVFYYLKSKQNLILHKFRTPNIPHVSKDFSQRFNLPIPDKEKQNLIANILHLNELQINLINKKIEKLKQIKESLLQNMFL